MKNLNQGILLLNYERKDFIAGFSLYSSPDQVSDQFFHLLHPSELSHYNSLKFEKRQQSYISGRIAAKKAISGLLPAVSLSSFSIDEGVFKFPVVKNLPNVQVSISHSGNITIALAYPEEHPMGIDIEKLDDQKLDSMRSQICDSELGLTNQLNLSPSTSCTMLWTIKETLSKVLKTGLTVNFKLLKIKSLQRQGSHYIATFTDFHQYKTISYCTRDYVCTIVLPIHTVVDLSQIWSALAGLEGFV